MQWFAQYPGRPGYLQIVSADLDIAPHVDFYDDDNLVSLERAAAEAWTPDGRVRLISTKRLPRETRLALKKERAKRNRDVLLAAGRRSH